MGVASGNSNPARKHVAGTLNATTAAAVALGVIYKGVWFNAAGTIDYVDSAGNKVPVTGAVGSCYPTEGYGAVTGGATTLSAGDFNLLL